LNKLNKDSKTTITYLVHGGNATATSYHPNILDPTRLHDLGLLIPNKKLRVALINDVSADSSDAHSSARLNSIYELCEDTSSGVLEIPQVDLNEEIYVTIIHHLGQRMIKTSVLFDLSSLLIQNVSLKLKVLAGVMPKGL